MIIYVAGYPKSGTTWITRLLGDVLDCRTGGSIPREDEREIATEGFDRKNKSMIVRKGHFVLNDTAHLQPVQRPHQLYWKGLREEEHKVVFVVRDPRDIVVSAAYHWKISSESALQNMVMGTNSFRWVGSWTSYINRWFERSAKFTAVLVRYEDMLKSSEELSLLVEELDYPLTKSKIITAYERQSFKSRTADVEKNGDKYNLGKEFNRKFMRKGVVGDWRNHFSRKTAFESETVFGDLLRLFEYESDAFWWKDVK